MHDIEYLGFARKTRKKRVIFCCPTIVKPYPCFLESLKKSIPIIEDAGWDCGSAWSVGSPYIAHARQTMLRKAQDSGADVIVFLDHDLSWEPNDLLALVESKGDVIAGTYRFKREPEEYMGAVLSNADGFPIVREDGLIKAHCVPAGFLKITREGINRFMFFYPELQYIEEGTLTVGLFQYGVHNGVFYGEDYAFSRNWNEKCGDIWIIPNLNINHHTENAVYKGNFHRYLLSCPGGSEHVSKTP